MDLSRCQVTFVHRGAPNDVLSIRGDEITELGRSFFRVGQTSIPYHRIQQIIYDEQIVYSA
ncbi:MAG: uncharacterized protein PWQ88_169 [Candidatus Methanomethylophilaceae archaeon]|nr:uncharacterized protein [Candidatus Methanomethylophilaceae archaeon]MDI3541692.1 uncharacterized protein [Candidatus Methanomethylophilaceae archaeon]